MGYKNVQLLSAFVIKLLSISTDYYKMFYVRFGVTTKQKTTLDKQKIKIKVIKHATTENIVSQRKRARDDERKQINSQKTLEQFSKWQPKFHILAITLNVNRQIL